MRLRLGLIACLSAVAIAPFAKAEVIERVVAVVNEEAIFLSDLRKRAVPFLPQLESIDTQTRKMALLKQLYDDLLTALIEEELFRQTANKTGIRVSVDDVDLAIKNIQEQNQMTDPQFWEAVRSQGLDPGQYKKDLRRQLIRFKVINERVRSRVNVTDEEIRRKYDERVRGSNKQFRFRISHVLMPIDSDASATEVADIRNRMEAVYNEATLENFDEYAQKVGGGELGWVEQGDLPQDIEQTLMMMEPDEISRPIRGKTGYHIFLLHERESGGELASYEEEKEKIFRELYDDAMANQERIFVQELKRKASISRML